MRNRATTLSCGGDKAYTPCRHFPSLLHTYPHLGLVIRTNVLQFKSISRVIQLPLTHPQSHLSMFLLTERASLASLLSYPLDFLIVRYLAYPAYLAYPRTTAYYPSSSSSVTHSHSLFYPFTNSTPALSLHTYVYSSYSPTQVNAFHRCLSISTIKQNETKRKKAGLVLLFCGAYNTGRRDVVYPFTCYMASMEGGGWGF